MLHVSSPPDLAARARQLEIILLNNYENDSRTIVNDIMYLGYRSSSFGRLCLSTSMLPLGFDG